MSANSQEGVDPAAVLARVREKIEEVFEQMLELHFPLAFDTPAEDVECLKEAVPGLPVEELARASHLDGDEFMSWVAALMHNVVLDSEWYRTAVAEVLFAHVRERFESHPQIPESRIDAAVQHECDGGCGYHLLACMDDDVDTWIERIEALTMEEPTDSRVTECSTAEVRHDHPTQGRATSSAANETNRLLVVKGLLDRCELVMRRHFPEAHGADRTGRVCLLLAMSSDAEIERLYALGDDELELHVARFVHTTNLGVTVLSEWSTGSSIG